MNEDGERTSENEGEEWVDGWQWQRRSGSEEKKILVEGGSSMQQKETTERMHQAPLRTADADTASTGFSGYWHWAAHDSSRKWALSLLSMVCPSSSTVHIR